MADERFNISLGLDTSDARKELSKFQRDLATVKAGNAQIVVPAEFGGQAKEVAGLVKELSTARSEVRQLLKEKKQLSKVNWDKLTPEEKKTNKSEMKRVKAELAAKEALIVQSGTRLEASVKGSEKVIDKLAKKITETQKALAALNDAAPKNPAQQKLSDEAKRLGKEYADKTRELARVRAEADRVKRTAIADYRKQGPGSSGRIFSPARKKYEELRSQEAALIPRANRTGQAYRVARQLADSSMPVTKEIKELNSVLAQLTGQRTDLNSYVTAVRSLVAQNDIPLPPRVRGKKETQNLNQFDPFEPMSRKGPKGAGRSSIASDIANQIIKSGSLRSNNNKDAGVVPNVMLAALVAIKAIPAEVAQGIAKMDLRTAITQQKKGDSALSYQNSKLPSNFAGDLSMAGLIKSNSAERLIGTAISDVEQRVSVTGGTMPQTGGEWGNAVFERMKTIIEQQYKGDEQAQQRIKQIVSDLKTSLEPIAKQGIGVLAGETSDMEDDTIEINAMDNLGNEINDLAALMKENYDSEEEYNPNGYSEDDVRTKVDKTGAIYSVLDNGMSGTSVSNEAGKNINDDNAFVRNLLTSISYGDKGGGRTGGTLDLDSQEAILKGFEKGGFNIADLMGGFFEVNSSNNPKNAEDNAEARMPVITSAQFKEAFFIASEAAKLINIESQDTIRELRAQRSEGFSTGVTTQPDFDNNYSNLSPAFSDVLNNRTRPGQYLADWEAAYGGEEQARDMEGPKGSKEKGGLRWVNVGEDLENQRRQRAAYEAATASSGAGNVTEYNGATTEFKTGQLSALKAPFEEVISVMTKIMTEGVRNPQLIPSGNDVSTDEYQVGELVAGNMDLFQKTFAMLPPALQELVTLAHDYAVATGIVSKTGGSPFNQDFNGTVNGIEPSMSTFEQMFNANDNSPESRIDYEKANGERGRVPTGYGPGQLEPVESLGVTKPLIVTVLDQLAKQFKDIYGASPNAMSEDNPRPFGQQMGMFDPKTFLPAAEDQLDAVRLSYIEAFTKNRDAYLEFISQSTIKISDITMALPAVEQLFEYVSSFKEGATGGHTLDEVKNARSMFQQGATPLGLRANEMGGFAAAGAPGKKQPLRYGQEFGMAIPAASKKLAGDAIFGGFDDRAREARERNARTFNQQSRTPQEVETALAANLKAEFDKQKQDLELKFLSWAEKKTVGEAEGAGRKILDKAKEDRASKQGQSIAENTVDGIKTGVTGKEAEIAEQGKIIGRAFAGGTEDELEINSPSRLFKRIAEHSADGLIVGSKQRLGDLSDAGKKMAEQFHAGYTDQAKVEAIAKIQNYLDKGNKQGAEAIYNSYKQAPAADQANKDLTGYKLSTPAEIKARNKAPLEAIDALKAANKDLIVALDIESTGALKATPASGDQPAKGAMRNRVFAWGATAGFGEESRQPSAGRNGVDIVRPNMVGINHNMVVPPVDPNREGSVFSKNAVAGILGDGNQTNKQLLDLLGKRIDKLGYPEQNKEGSEQAYVNQLEDIAALLMKLYETGTPLAIHSKTLSDLTTLGKEFAHYGIEAPTGGQMRDAGMLVETQNMSTMLSGIFKEFNDKFSQKLGNIYKFFSGTEMGSELTPKTGSTPKYAPGAEAAHDPQTDANATLVVFKSMMEAAKQYNVKQKGWFKELVDFTSATVQDASSAIWGNRRERVGNSPLQGMDRQAATHGGQLQPAVPNRNALVTPSSTQATLFDDAEISQIQDDAKKRQAYEAELARLMEERAKERDRLAQERLKAERQYKIDMVEQLMSENKAIGFDNLSDSKIAGKTITSAEKPKLAKNNAAIAKAMEDKDIAQGVATQINMNGKVRNYFVAKLEKPSRELADEIQKAIDKAKRAINKMDEEAGTRTPVSRSGRGGAGKPPRKSGIPGGGYSDEPTPEYKALVQDSANPGNQNQAWLDMEIERQQSSNKHASQNTANVLKDQVAFEKEMEKTNRKMVDGWISTRYSLYDVASTYEDMGKKLKVFTSYIRDAVLLNASYETSFTAVERVMQPLPDEIDGMRQRLVLMTQELPVAFDELARIATLGGQMGINADGINNFTEQVVKYSAITGMSADTVAEKFGRISQLADIPADDFNKLASAVAYAGINAVATDQEIITLTESISAASNLAGFGADETIGLATAISSLGIAPEQARGVIVRLFGDIERSMQAGGKGLDSYSKHLGLSAKETKDLWNTDPQGFFKRMLDNLSKSKSMTTALDNLNIKETREVNTLQRLANNMDVYNQSMSDAQESYANGTFLSEAYAKTQDNVAAKMTILNNQIKILQDNLGEAFGPLFKTALDAMSWFMDWINKMTSNPMGKWVTGITVALSALVAGFVAYQVMTYKATAATLALKTSMLQLGKMGGEHTGIKGLVDVLTAQERMIIRSNGKIESLSKKRLEAMQATGDIKMVDANSPAGRALTGGLSASAASNPSKMEEILAQRAGNVMDPMAQNPNGILAGTEVPGPSIAQLKETIAVNQQLAQIKAKQIQDSIEAATAAELEAKASGDLVKAKEQEVIVAGLSRDQRQIAGIQETLSDASAQLAAPSVDGVVSEKAIKNVAQTTVALDGMGAGLDNVAVAADRGSAATSTFGKAVGVATKAAGALMVLFTVLSFAKELYDSFQINLQEAGGGLDSFREAIYKDTAAWKENGQAIGTAQSTVTESKVGLTAWAQSMESTTGSSAKMTTAITETTDSIEKQTLALGANSMEWLAQAAMNDDVIQGMFKSYFRAGQDLGEISKKVNINLQDMIGMALKSPGKNGAQEYLKQWFTASNEVNAVAPNLYGDLNKIAIQLDSTTQAGVENSKMMKALGNGFKGTDDDLNGLNNQLDNTIARVYTLTDYVGDLSSILSAAFTIRFGKEEATDALATSWENVKNRIDDARKAIEKIKDEIKSMTADRNILEYQLNIALKYGDSMRADKLRAELDAKNKELADKSEELGTAQDGASTSLVGNTKAASDNRAVMRGLVQDYYKYLEALANTNLSQKELKKRSDQAKADMLAQGQALGFSANEMDPYVKSFKDFRTIVDKLPKELTLRVDADPGTRAFMEWWVKQKSGSGSSSNNATSNTAGGGTNGPDGKPAKPMWTGPSTNKYQPGNQAPVRAADQGNVWLAQITDQWHTISDLFDGNWWRDKFEMKSEDFRKKWTNRGEIEANKYNEEYNQRVEAYKKAKAQEAAVANDINRQIASSGASKSELKAMAAEHAAGNPGVWNPFNGTFNPGKRAEVKFPAPVKDPIKDAREILGRFSAAQGGRQKKTAIDAIRADDKNAFTTQTTGIITSAGLGKEYLKGAGAKHAAQYPGEYNPFTREVNPWPQSQKDLKAKGLVPLKTRAELHAITNPGEWNPYSGVVNPMFLSGDQQKQSSALKDKKTRKALGEAHALKYPGEYNPYTESINPMFDKNSQKGAKAIATSTVEGAQKKNAIDALRADDRKAVAQGTKKKDPIYAYIVGTDVATNFAGGKMGYASGGLIPGKSPQNPRVDNLLASGPGGVIGIRSGEYIQNQQAVQYYGLDFMNAINNMQIPRYASGGMIGSVSGGGSSVVELSPSAVMQIMAIANRPVNLYSDDRQIASSANRGNMLLAMRGSN